MVVKSKNSLGSLLGILVLAALLFLLLNMFGAAQLGKFGCGWEPNVRIGAVAEAAGECPESLAGAMGDAQWAADRYAEIANEPKTVGLFYDEDGFEHRIRSGDEKGTDARRASKYLQELGAPTDRTGRYPAATHVEVKVAALMRETGVKTGVLIINYEGGPCPGTVGTSCREVLPQLVLGDTHLRIWYMELDGSGMKFKDYGRG